MRRALLSFLASFALAGPPAAAQAPAQPEPKAKPAERLVLIGTGGLTGIYSPAGGAVCRIVNRFRKQTGLRCGAESTEGSIANLRGLRTGDLEFAIAQSGSVYDASRGEGLFAKAGPDTELRAVFSLHSETFTILARKESNVRVFDDLRGKRISAGEPGSGTRAVAQEALAAIGWSAADFAQVANLRSGEDGTALCDGRIDALFAVIGHPSDLIRLPAAICNARLVNLAGERAQKIIASRPFLAASVIPGATYPANPQDTRTFGVRAVLVARSTLPDDTVYTLVKAIFENFQEFRKLHPALDPLAAEVMIKDGITTPYHPGAARFYRERGWVQ